MSAQELTDAEFDALHGGRELLPIEQVAYEHEGAERFKRVHGHGRKFDRVTTPQTEGDTEKWVAKLNSLARDIDSNYQSFHPSVAREQSKALTEEWKRNAAKKEPA